MHVLIVGAGVAGLTLAHELLRSGHRVTLVELQESVGGLARSFHYGAYAFDLGPHRFHTENPRVKAFIRDVLGENVLEIRRRSGVWFFNRLHEWPLEPASLLHIPVRQMVRAGVDLAALAVRDAALALRLWRPRPRPATFEQYVLSRYGRTIYRLFFQPYTEKFIKYRCDQLHESWAVAGINRAVIDKRVEVTGLFNLLRRTLLPQKVETRFLYPRRGGIGAFAEALAERIRLGGGRILTGTRIAALVRQGERITAAVDNRGGRHALDHLFWTAPLPQLCRLLGLADPGLEYLSSLFLNFEVDGRPDHPYQWIYYGGPDIVFSRASFPVLFSPETAPPGKHGICVEIACMEGDGYWQNPEWAVTDVRRQMVKVGLVERVSALEACHIERVRNTYPIYTLGYQERKAAATRAVRQAARNVNLLGRTGTFWYNNMDHSIAQALAMARKVEAAARDLSVSTEEIFQG